MRSSSLEQKRKSFFICIWARNPLALLQTESLTLIFGSLSHSGVTVGEVTNQIFYIKVAFFVRTVYLLQHTCEKKNLALANLPSAEWKLFQSGWIPPMELSFHAGREERHGSDCYNWIWWLLLHGHFVRNLRLRLFSMPALSLFGSGHLTWLPEAAAVVGGGRRFRGLRAGDSFAQGTCTC